MNYNCVNYFKWQIHYYYYYYYYCLYVLSNRCYLQKHLNSPIITHLYLFTTQETGLNLCYEGCYLT